VRRKKRKRRRRRKMNQSLHCIMLLKLS